MTLGRNVRQKRCGTDIVERSDKSVGGDLGDGRLEPGNHTLSVALAQRHGPDSCGNKIGGEGMKIGGDRLRAVHPVGGAMNTDGHAIAPHERTFRSISAPELGETARRPFFHDWPCRIERGNERRPLRRRLQMTLP